MKLEITLDVEDVDCERIEHWLSTLLECNVTVVEAKPRPQLKDLFPKTIPREDMLEIVKDIHFRAGPKGRVYVAYLIFHNIRKHLTGE